MIIKKIPNLLLRAHSILEHRPLVKLLLILTKEELQSMKEKACRCWYMNIQSCVRTVEVAVTRHVRLIRKRQNVCMHIIQELARAGTEQADRNTYTVKNVSKYF